MKFNDIRSEQLRVIREMNGTVPLETWCAVMEQHLSKDQILAESVNQENVERIQNLVNSFSSSPVVGEEYIFVPLFLVGDTIQVFDVKEQFPATNTPEFHTLVQVTESGYSCRDVNGIIREWPIKRLSDLSFMTTILVKSMQDYGRLKVWMELAFGVSMV